MNNNSGQFPSVVGYISQPERIALQRCVLDTAHIPGDALEIGSLNGLSALLILSVLDSSKNLICIEKGQTETLSKNLFESGLSDNFVIINNDFNIVELSGDAKLSFVFIDHDHTYENTIAAFNRFWPLLSSGGIIAFHDYGHPEFPGGSKAIQELMNNFPLKHWEFAGGFVSFQK
jgi:predicted O-methyltransferase YrrM